MFLRRFKTQPLRQGERQVQNDALSIPGMQKRIDALSADLGKAEESLEKAKVPPITVAFVR